MDVAETVLKQLLNRIKEQRSEVQAERTQQEGPTQDHRGRLCVCVC